MAEQPKENKAASVAQIDEESAELLAEASEAYLLALKGALKPGAKTSEMWMAVVWGLIWVAAFALVLAGQLDSGGLADFDMSGFLFMLIAIVVGGAPTYKYIDGRSKVKASYYELPEYNRELENAE